MTISCYKSGNSIMIAAHYKGSELIIMSLIIIKIRFVCFQKDEVNRLYVKSYTGSHTRSYTRSCIQLHNYKSCDHGITISKD